MKLNKKLVVLLVMPLSILGIDNSENSAIDKSTGRSDGMSTDLAGKIYHSLFVFKP